MFRQLIYTGLTLVLVVSSFHKTFAESSFPLPKSYPILWTKSTEQYKFKDKISSLTIKFYSPCDFDFETGIVNGTQEYFKNWCENEIKSKVYIPLIEMCDNHGRKRRNSDRQTLREKEKSSFSENIDKINEIVGVIGNVAETILGLFGKSQTQNYDDEVTKLNNQINSLNDSISVSSNQIDTLSKQVWENSEKLVELESQRKHHSKLIQEQKDATKKLDEKLGEIDDRVDFLEKWKESTIRDFGSTITLASKLTSYFEWCGKEIPEISRDWKSKKFNRNKFFTIFNLQNDNELLTRFETVQPMSCHIDPIRNIAKFVVKYPDTHDGALEVFEPHPFTLIERIPRTHFVYRAEYIGPKSVISSNQNPCIVPILYNSNALIPTDQEHCDEPLLNTSVSKYWKTSCLPMPYLSPSEIIQIKTDGTNQFIYCYGFQIQIFSRKYIPCPPFVFPLKLNDEFKFQTEDNTVFGYHRLSSISENLNTDYVQSNKINSHLMPNLLSIDLQNEKDFPASIPCIDFQGVHPAVAKYELNLPMVFIWISSIFLILILIGLISGVIYIKTKRQNTNHDNPSYGNVEYAEPHLLETAIKNLN